MPLELMELWARQFGIKEGLLEGHWLSWALSGSFFLEDAWMIMLQLPVFPNRQYFGWEETQGTA